MYSICKQKYSYKRLLALHPTEKRTYPDAFKFPSCCSCYIKYLDDYLGRSNSRKLESKVDVRKAESRDGRAMMPTTNDSIVMVHSNEHSGDNSTIEIMSQVAVTELNHNNSLGTSLNSAPPAKNESSTSQTIVPQ